MPVEQYDGVHSTCAANAPSIEANGFYLSPDDRYVGPAVYFYINNERGQELAKAQLQEKLKKSPDKGGCPYDDKGVFIHALITSDAKMIIDFTSDENAILLKTVEDEFWKEYNNVRNMTRTEKYKILNRRRNAFLNDLCKEIPCNLVKLDLPIGSKYGLGLAVFNVDCISKVSILEI